MPSTPTPRILQQQPERPSDLQQQQSGSNDLQPKPTAQKEQQMGEGSYEGSRDYQQRTEEYLKKADVEADAEAAKPRSEQDARELDEAEKEGRSHSKGEH
ncbi:MAG: hypothetical protein H0X13_01165 [Ramlibacter sp.]|nr:hypothetical protein [Ramlibacter sp.]